MRPRTGAERTLLAADNQVHMRVMVANSGGTLTDVSTYFVAATVHADVDNGAMTATLEMDRALAPLLVNNIDVDRRITIESAVVTPGVSPGAGDWKNVFSGYIDVIDSGPNPMQVTCRDLSKKLLDTFIEVVRPYGAATPGIALENVIQGIIDDNAPPAPSPTWNPYPTVQLPVGSPGAMLLEFDQAQMSVMEAVQQRAQQIGWDIRYRYGTGATPTLQLYSIPRTSPTVLDTFTPAEYIDIPELPLDDENIRNYGEIFYTDAATGVLSVATAFDSTSITKFGRRYFALGGDAVAAITSAGEAQDMIDAAVLDLAFPRASQTARMRYYWPVELQDFYGWAANSVHYASQQNFAVAAFTHTFRDGQAFTEIRASGNPAGAYDAWLRAGAIDLQGQIPGFPEVLYVAAPIEILGPGGVITGYRLSGRVDLDTNALIIELSTGLTLQNASPTATHVTTPTVQDWLPMPPAGFFTIEVALASGKTGTVTLTPASLFNPTDPPPRGGTLGSSYVQRLQFGPVTTITIKKPSQTVLEVTLTVRPATATIKYRFAPYPPGPAVTDPWITAVGTVTFAVDVSQGAILLEYYSVSTDNVAEELHSLVLDEDDIPQILDFQVAENNPNELTCTIVLDDDVHAWAIYAKRGGTFPDIGVVNQMDPQYLRFNGTRRDNEFTFYAAGNGVSAGNVDQWLVVAVAYDLYGVLSYVFGQVIVVQGTGGTPPTAGALSSLVVEPNPTYLDVTWVPNGIVEAAVASRFQVRITENSVPMVVAGDARPAVNDPDNTNTIPNYGGWRRSITESTVGTPGAVYLTLTYDVGLYDTGILVATYSAIYQGYFLQSSTGSPPSGTPTASTLALGAYFGAVEASWSGLGLDPTLAIEIEWHVSTDNFVANDTVFENVLLPPNTQSHTSYGHSPTLWVRERRRYVNSVGNGAWTGYSTAIQMTGSILP